MTFLSLHVQVQFRAHRAPQRSGSLSRMRILLIPLTLMLAVVVVVLALMPNAIGSSDAVTRAAKP